MGRREPLSPIGGCTMQTIEHRAFQLLLQEPASQAFGDTAHAPCRRDLYGKTFSGVA